MEETNNLQDLFYDYIFVGSGPSMTLALHTIKEKQPESKILVLERGPDNKKYPETNKTGNPGVLYFNNEILIEKESIPQEGCNNKKKQVYDVNIKGGGCSINSMVFAYGAPSDYTYWSKNFSFEKIKSAANYMKEYMKISNNYSVDFFNKQISFVEPSYQLKNDDLVNGNLDGIAYQYLYCNLETKTEDGVRNSMYRRFAEGYENYKNVLILTESKVKNVVFKKKDNEYIRPLVVDHVNVVFDDGSQKKYYCRKNTFICAGVFGSVEVLFNSGLGPKENLENANIECLENLPELGKNLKDQVEIKNIYKLNKEPKLSREKPPLLAKYMKNIYIRCLFLILGLFPFAFICVSSFSTVFKYFILNGLVFLFGILYGIIGLEFIISIVGFFIFMVGSIIVASYHFMGLLICFVLSFWLGFVFENVIFHLLWKNLALNGLIYTQMWSENLQYYFFIGYGFEEALPILIYFQNFKWLQYLIRKIMLFFIKFTFFKYWFMKDVLVTLITLRKPKSTGSYVFEDGVWKIDIGYLKEKKDLVDLLKGLQYNEEMMNDLGYSLELLPFADQNKEEYIKNNCSTTYHLTGTCKMSASKNYGVVDQNDGLKVFGTENLHVFGAPTFFNPISTSNSVVCAAIGYIAVKDFILKK